MNLDRSTKELVTSLEGPVLVTGCGGFLGAQFLSLLQTYRSDVFGTARTSAGWRFEAFNLRQILPTLDSLDLRNTLDWVGAKTIFNLAAHGAYSFQSDREQIVRTNFSDLMVISDWAERTSAAVIHAGTSSEYGWNSAAPTEEDLLQPNSLYAVTKAAASHWLLYRAKEAGLATVILRLYSVYGPGEDPSRLIPTLIREGRHGALPAFAERRTSRDLVYVDDVLDAFLRAGVAVRGRARGHAINIGTGTKMDMESIASQAKTEFGIAEEPHFGEMGRFWDLQDWYADPSSAERLLGWAASVPFHQGLALTRDWYERPGNAQYLDISYSRSLAETSSEEPVAVSAIVACYRDAEAIPIMYERLKNTFVKLRITFEIIFVNDNSPDDSLEVIERISLCDPRVRGITHSRNFGSQAAFLSGMSLSTGQNCVLLDGDLQDPPELIEQFWEKKSEGFDVVYGRRVEREASWLMRHAYKGFYRVFQILAPFQIPRDAGDFSLMSRVVVDEICEMPERDLFIRAQRAYVGYRQAGIDYKRPERMFGKTTNNLGKNLGWATRGVLAVSRAPLTALSIFSLSLFAVSLLLIVAQVIAKILIPSSAPDGVISISVLILGLGSLNLLAISIVGEYVGRILEESKRRPRFVRRLVTQSGRSRHLVEGERK
jgi:nucleoside-diphosphate-sugar epimerase/glycosyltransferase involved in cell wall biosynthesis